MPLLHYFQSPPSIINTTLDATVAEGATGIIGITFSYPLLMAATVAVRNATSTATFGVDYSATWEWTADGTTFTPFTQVNGVNTNINVPAGSVFLRLRITTLTDAASESTETLNVLFNPISGLSGGNNQATLSITDVVSSPTGAAYSLSNSNAPLVNINIGTAWSGNYAQASIASSAVVGASRAGSYSVAPIAARINSVSYSDSLSAAPVTLTNTGVAWSGNYSAATTILGGSTTGVAYSLSQSVTGYLSIVTAIALSEAYSTAGIIASFSASGLTENYSASATASRFSANAYSLSQSVSPTIISLTGSAWTESYSAGIAAAAGAVTAVAYALSQSIAPMVFTVSASAYGSSRTAAGIIARVTGAGLSKSQSTAGNASSYPSIALSENYSTAAPLVISINDGAAWSNSYSAATLFDSSIQQPIDTHDGYWSKQWVKLHDKRKPKLKDVIEIVKENPIEAIAEVREIVALEYPKINYQDVLNNAALQKFIAQQLIQAIERDHDEDDVEMMLL